MNRAKATPRPAIVTMPPAFEAPIMGGAPAVATVPAEDVVVVPFLELELLALPVAVAAALPVVDADAVLPALPVAVAEPVAALPVAVAEADAAVLPALPVADVVEFFCR
jgi:hypothetical protein